MPGAALATAGDAGKGDVGHVVRCKQLHSGAARGAVAAKCQRGAAVPPRRFSPPTPQLLAASFGTAAGHEVPYEPAVLPGSSSNTVMLMWSRGRDLKQLIAHQSVAYSSYDCSLRHRCMWTQQSRELNPTIYQMINGPPGACQQELVPLQ